MTDTQIWNAILSFAVALVLWCLKEIWTLIKGVQKDLADHKTHVATTHVTKADYHLDMQYIRVQLDKIIDKLDGKADK